MNARQLKAAESLRIALEKCSRAGLAGGVYEYRMRVWPIEATEEIINGGPSSGFFERANRLGLRLESSMNLDGGAGA